MGRDGEVWEDGLLSFTFVCVIQGVHCMEWS